MRIFIDFDNSWKYCNFLHSWFTSSYIWMAITAKKMVVTSYKKRQKIKARRANQWVSVVSRISNEIKYQVAPIFDLQSITDSFDFINSIFEIEIFIDWCVLMTRTRNNPNILQHLQRWLLARLYEIMFCPTLFYPLVSLI